MLGRPGTRPEAALRWEGGTLPPRRACKRGQSRTPPGALSGAPGRRTDPDRAQRVGRRSRRARSARALGCLFSGSIGTFDDLFARLIRSDPEQRPVATDAQRALVVRRTLAAASLNGLSRSARTGGFADTLLSTLGELEQGLLDPGDLSGDLADLYAAYRAELDRLKLWDRDLLRRRAAERLASDLDAWPASLSSPTASRI